MMNIGILIPGFSSDENDWSIPVQQHLARILSQTDDVRILALRYPHRRDCYKVYNATVYSLGVAQARGLRRLALWMDTLLTLRHLHHERKFDVLHAMWADETGLLAVWAGRLLNIPSVVSIVGGELVGFPTLNYGLQRGKFSHWIVGQALKADCVIAASDYARRLIPMAGYPVADARVRVIPLGVDAEMFRPFDPTPYPSPNSGRGEKIAQNSTAERREQGIEGDEIVVEATHESPLTPQPPLPRKRGEGEKTSKDGTYDVGATHESPLPTSTHDAAQKTTGEVRLIHAASLVPIKDQGMLLRALARLDESVVLDIIGTGTEEAKLKALAEELGISKRVNFVGAVGHTDLPPYYQRATLHILTSQHEGQALVTVEAGACGVPTVGTAVGLLADTPEFGIAVPVGDDEALAKAIQSLLDDDERRRALRQSARAAVERNYTIERTAERFEALYKTLGR